MLMEAADIAGIKAVTSYKEYTTAHRDVSESLGKRPVLDCCLWLAERRYLLAATDSISEIKKVAMFVLQLVKRFVRRENSRNAAISAAMKQFVSLQETTFSPVDIAGSVLSELSSINTVDDTTVLTNLFQPGEIQVLKQFTDKPTLEEAIFCWDVIVPAPMPLALICGKVYIESSNSWVKMKGVVSGDGFLHLFDRKKDEMMVDPCVSLQLAENRVEMEINGEAMTVMFRGKVSRIKNLIKQQDVLLLKLTNGRKFAAWQSLLPRFLPSYTSIDPLTLQKYD